MFLVIDLVPMRPYECFRRRRRFLNGFVNPNLTRILVTDILVVSVVTRTQCKTEPKAPTVDEISNLLVHVYLPFSPSRPKSRPTHCHRP